MQFTLVPLRVLASVGLTLALSSSGYGQKVETFSFAPLVGVPITLSPREQPLGLAGLTVRYHPSEAYALGMSYQVALSRYAASAAPGSFTARIRCHMLLLTHDYYLGKGIIRPLLGWGVGFSSTVLNSRLIEQGTDSTHTEDYDSLIGLLPKVGVQVRACDRLSLEFTGTYQHFISPVSKQDPAEFSVKSLGGTRFFASNSLFSLQATLRYTIRVRYD